jgi:hypothetical protein
LPTAKKASESPRFQPDKNICDSGDKLDTKEKKKKNLQPTRLNFEAEKNSNDEIQSESSNTNGSNKNIQSNTPVGKMVNPKENNTVLKDQQNNVAKSYSFLASLSGMNYKYQLL